MKEALRMTAHFMLLAWTAAMAPSFAKAEESVQPYIDSVKKDIKDKSALPTQESPQPYIDSLKSKIGPAPAPVPGSDTSFDSSYEGYTERLKKELEKKDDPAKGFTNEEKAKLGAEPRKSAIEDLKEGRELHPVESNTTIHHAGGFRLGLSMSRDIQADADVGTGRGFTDVYGSGFAPDFTLFYEWQPWHSEFWGNFGIAAQIGVSFFHANGLYGVPLTNPAGGTFGDRAPVKFLFFDVPVSASLDYRFNLAKYVRPFVMGGPSVIPFIESRDDNKAGHHGISEGFYAVAGAAFLLDWISSGSKQDLYSEAGIKHYYLTIEYSRLSTFAGGVTFLVQGADMGLTFEF